MKPQSLFYAFCLILCSAFCWMACSPKSQVAQSQNKLKARFEKSALCYNYTFSVIEGRIDTSLVDATWTNPQTKTTYKNAFGIANPCDFPKDIKEGDTFYFEIIEKPENKACVACMAFYPTPAKHINIKVIR